MTVTERRPAAFRGASPDTAPPPDTRTLKRQRRAQEDDADAASETVEGGAGTAIDWTYLSGSNETESEGFGVVHVNANDTDAWESVFPNGSTVKIIYVSGSGSTDTIVIVPDDDDSESDSASASASASQSDSASAAESSTESPVYALPTEGSSGSSSSSGSASVESASGTMSTAVTYSIIFAVVAVAVVIIGVVLARRFSAKRTRSNQTGRARTYDLSTMFQVVRSRRRTSSPSILGDTATNYRHQLSSDNESSPMRPTTILADTETASQRRPTLTLTPLRRTDRLARATEDARRQRASTSPVILYES